MDGASLGEHDARELSERKILKVKIPVEQQAKLHTLKVLTGTTLSEAVEAALEGYFEDQDAQI